LSNKTQEKESMSAGSPESEASPVEDAATTKATPTLSISPKVCFIVVKAREFDAKDMVTIPDEASNATDDAMMSVLEDHIDDPVAASCEASSRTGRTCARKPLAYTTSARPRICWEC
jgi:hypothetical protein